MVEYKPNRFEAPTQEIAWLTPEQKEFLEGRGFHRFLLLGRTLDELIQGGIVRNQLDKLGSVGQILSAAAEVAYGDVLLPGEDMWKARDIRPDIKELNKELPSGLGLVVRAANTAELAEILPSSGYQYHEYRGVDVGNTGGGIRIRRLGGFCLDRKRPWDFDSSVVLPIYLHRVNNK